MTHLLIDRFRFDSFAPDSDEAGSNLLTRFGEIVYLFLMITPPASLVERAWQRGLDVGRYKAVDDVLAHAVEAYAGMPGLFFTWANRTDKRVHFEFLDNSVRAGRAAANRRLRLERHAQRPRCRRTPRRRAISTRRRRRAPGPDALSRGRRARRRGECGVPDRMRAPVPRGQFRRPGERPLYARVESGHLAWADPAAARGSASRTPTCAPRSRPLRRTSSRGRAAFRAARQSS